MTEHEDDDKIILTCSVLTYGDCRYTVEWLKDDFTVMETSHHYCSASVNIKTSHLTDQYYKLLQCKVTDIDSKIVQVFNFSLQTSKEKTGEGGSGVRPTIKPGTSEETNNTTSSPDNNNTPDSLLWLYIVLALGLAALITVVLIRWKKTKGNKTQMDGNMGLTLNPAETLSDPQTFQDTTDPEHGVSYASISYTKKTKSKARVQGDDGEGGAVTYSTVKASSSSAGASIDPSNLYATIK
ncbi:uncharacterized protein LOC127142646 [Lates calcarifer]|uniref:Uncharacterized protein LOC127142646 n=1 Tax=Lates calcarifer TaxID=8187 RepID=A0AAJ8B7I4_LATCA|nr:uncharacterized protein LOC127142646 [Lates calcarifer]